MNIKDNPFIKNQGSVASSVGNKFGAAAKGLAKGGSANRLLPGILTFSWTKDMSRIALCPTTSEIWIFDTGKEDDISKWTRTHVLTEHYNEVTSLQWNPTDQNKLMSASADRGCIIWQYDTQSKEFRP